MTKKAFDKIAAGLSDALEIAREQPPYNDGYTHEALHAAHITISMWDDHVLQTRCADQFPDVKVAIEEAAEAMGRVYQLIGQKFEDE
ncbi:hypothetical protein CK489_15505 [Bradyrhizobium sp. UFLA03-84]|uniref:hypothetical protein n=1 Tax=Bradyrhizobium sp. UFLA03-84 TaxID=418599 RepID=UPI000BADE5F7|nr:hypothetical protein [Bradyrhizobium sp. UFLA03-84]PAY07203.1 hypothetical protein CK489_15505 [Bradyrhizobium sp. UFLA03-84]